MKKVLVILFNILIADTVIPQIFINNDENFNELTYIINEIDYYYKNLNCNFSTDYFFYKGFYILNDLIDVYKHNVNKNLFYETGTIDFTVFPNPVRNELHIILHTFNEHDTFSIDIFDMLGNLVLSNRLNSKENIINFQNFKNGLYILKIRNNLTCKAIRLIKI